MILRKRTTLVGVTFVLVAMGLLAGCGKKKAEGKIAEAQAVQQEAEAQRMSVYMPAEHKVAAGMIEQANQLKDAGEYEQSINQAEQAMGRFRDGLTQLSALRSEIDELWNQLDEIQQAIDGHLTVANEQAVVSKDEVETVQNEAYEIRNREDDLLKKPERNGSVDREFLKKAIDDLKAVSVKSLALSTAHLKPQAEEAINGIRQKWNEAESLDAKSYEADLYTQVQTAVNEIEADFTGQIWQSVIDKSPALNSTLDNLLEKTRIAASDVKVQEAAAKVERALKIQAPDVKTYAEFLTDAQAALDKARTAQGAGQAAEAFAGADEALGLVDAAQSALGDQVSANLDEANKSIEAAIAKEAQQYAKKELDNAESLVSASKTALADGNYFDAYQTSQAAKAAAATVITAAETGKAKSLLAGVEAKLNDMANQGARERAAEAYGKAQGVVGEMQSALSAGNYDQVVVGVPNAEAAINEIRDALAVSAGVAIEEADAAIVTAQKSLEEVEAKSAQAEHLLAEALKAREEAVSARDAAKFGTTFSRVKKVVDLSTQAQAQAYSDGSSQLLVETGRTLDLARSASAPSESPDAYRRALDLEKSARDTLASGKAQAAYRLSLDARQASQNALDNLVNMAAAAVDDAREAGAETYSPNDIKRAESIFNQAREAHENRNFAKANELAKQAAGVAAEAESFSWRQRVTALLSELETTEKQMVEFMVEQRAPESSVDFRVNLTRARASFAAQQWEDAFNSADAADRAANQAWQMMKDEVEHRLAVIQDHLAQTAANADDTSEKQALDALTTQVGQVVNALALQQYNEAYILSEALLKQTSSNLAGLEQANREQAAKNLQKQLVARLEEGAAEIMQEETRELAAFMDELKDADSETSYDTLMAQVNAWNERLSTMPERSLENASARLDQIAQLFASARQNDAEKLYPNQLRKLEGEYNLTRNAVDGKNIRDVADRLIPLEKDVTEFEAASRLAKEEDNYKKVIAGLLIEMQSLMNDFKNVASLNKTMLKTMRATTTTIESEVTNAYRSLQDKITARSFRRNADSLEQRVRATQPPATNLMKKLYDLSCKSFHELAIAAKGFDEFDNPRYDLGYRNEQVVGAYDHLERVLTYNEEIEYILNRSPEATWREGWQRKSKIARRTMYKTMFEDFNFKTDRYEDRLFHVIFRVEDVQKQVR